MWIAGLAVIAAIAATYQLTRPPELVWWTSPPLVKTGRRVAFLVPGDWVREPLDPSQAYPGGYVDCVHVFAYADRRPALLRRLFPKNSEYGTVSVRISYQSFSDSEASVISHLYDNGARTLQMMERTLERHDFSTWASISYARSDKAAFDRTYKQICNSLRIE